MRTRAAHRSPALRSRRGSGDRARRDPARERRLGPDAALMLADLAAPALLLAGPGTDLGPTPDGVVRAELGGPVPEGRWATVLLVVTDETALRTAVSALPTLGRAKHIGCHLATAAGPVTTLLRPEWPPLARLVAETPDGGALTRMTFRRPAPVSPVLVELARHTGTPAWTGNHGLVVTGAVLPVDPTVVTDEVPAAVVVGGADDLPEDPVLARVPAVVEPGPDPLDEALLNPVGFRRDWDRGPTPLPAGEPTPEMVAALRDAQSVVVGPHASPRTVAGLAMAGVPLVGDGFGEPDVDDPMRREEHSIRIRRAALREHSALAWRRRVGAATGVRVSADPTVSVLLAVRRPDLLEFALRQVARQRDVELELVLAPHGFEPDPGLVRAHLGDRPHTVVRAEADAVLGDVLRLATDAAGGDVVVTMDDDDWYGPDVVADLLLARAYSGADLVGMPAEMVYLESTRTTVRRRGPSETFGAAVAGGTMTVDRGLLRAVGGFRPVPRHVDACLLEDLRAAGGTVYGTHGLGHVLRQPADGSTEDAAFGHPLEREEVAARWPGFHPSELLEDA